MLCVTAATDSRPLGSARHHVDNTLIMRVAYPVAGIHSIGVTGTKGKNMATLELTMLSPLATYLDEIADASKFAPRPTTLDGKVLGLLPNWRPSAIHILNALGNLLKERYQLKAVVMEQPVRELPLRAGKLLDTMKEQLDSLVGRVDVVITASGD